MTIETPNETLADIKKLPDPPEGVKWPNHLHVDATYPCSKTRRDIMREVLGGEGKYGYGDHDAYPFVLEAMHKVLGQADRYLCRQYYHRDLAIKALKDNDVETALSHLNEIGKIGI